MATPDQVTIRALDVAGATITEQTIDATWQRTGGTARCPDVDHQPAVVARVPR